jgi:hypothetical protein
LPEIITDNSRVLKHTLKLLAVDTRLLCSPRFSDLNCRCGPVTLELPVVLRLKSINDLIWHVWELQPVFEVLTSQHCTLFSLSQVPGA